MDDIYLKLHDDALWIRMELMERSLADVLALYDELVVSEKLIARFTRDVSRYRKSKYFIYETEVLCNRRCLVWPTYIDLALPTVMLDPTTCS